MKFEKNFLEHLSNYVGSRAKFEHSIVCCCDQRYWGSACGIIRVSKIVRRL